MSKSFVNVVIETEELSSLTPVEETVSYAHEEIQAAPIISSANSNSRSVCRMPEVIGVAISGFGIDTRATPLYAGHRTRYRL